MYMFNRRPICWPVGHIHVCLWNMQNEICPCLDLITKDFPWTTSSWWRICLCTIPVYASMLMAPVTHAAPPYRDRRVFCICRWLNVWKVPLVSGTENSTSVFPKKQVEIWTLLSTAHISTVFWLSEMSSGPENPVLSLHKIDSFLLEQKRFKLHFLMQQQTVLSESGFLKYSWAHVAI